MADEKKQLSVLLIDDDAFLLSMYATKFQKAGFTVTTTARANEALKKIHDGLTPDILLVDIVMPEVTGLEFVTALRKDGLVPKAVVIMLTNDNGQDEISTAKDLKVAGYIVKATSTPSEVVALVTDMYEKHTSA